MVSLRQHLLETAKKFKIDGTDKSIIEFSLAIIDNMFNPKERCVQELRSS